MHETQKEWFIVIEGVKEGPYSIVDLRQDRRVTPDTLVWKAGWKTWLPMRKVPELKKVFEDVEKGDEEQDIKKNFQKKLPEDDTLALSTEPPYLWMIIALLAILFALYQFMNLRH